MDDGHASVMTVSMISRSLIRLGRISLNISCMCIGGSVGYICENVCWVLAGGC